MVIRATLWVVLATAIGLLRTYGQGLHLYDPAGDKLAQKILATYSNSPAAKIVDLEKARFDDYASRLADLRQLEGQANRDLALSRLLTSTNSGNETLTDIVSARLQELAGTNRPPHKSSELSTALFLLDTSAAQFKLVTGRSLPPFSLAASNIPPEKIDEKQLKGLDDTTKANASAFYADYWTNWLALKTNVDGFTNGVIGAARTRWLDFLARQAADQADLKNKQSDVDTNQNALDTAIKNSSTNLTANAFTTFTNYLQTVTNFSVLGLTNLTARYAYISMGIQTLDAALQTLQTGTVPKTLAVTNAAVVKALTFTSSTSNLWSSAADLEAAIRRPPLAKLRVQLAILQVDLAEIQQRLKLEQNRVTLAQNAFTAAVEEASLLDDCRQSLKAKYQAGGNDTILTRLEHASVRQVFESGEPQLKERLYAALVLYLDAQRIANVKQRLIEDQLNMTYFEESRIINASALKMWDALITEPINQLAVYYGDGFKKEDVAKLVVGALGLGAIAWRTGK